MCKKTQRKNISRDLMNDYDDEEVEPPRSRQHFF